MVSNIIDNSNCQVASQVTLFLLITNLTHFFQCIRLFHSSTCFEQHGAHHQENQFYQYVIWYVSLCVDDCLVCRSGDRHTRQSPTQSDTFQMTYWYNWFSWWWAPGCSKHVQEWNKRIQWKKCVKLAINKNCTEMHGQQNIKKTQVTHAYLWGWHDRICIHDPIRILFADFWNEKRSHSRASPSTKRVRKLKSLKTITVFALLPHDVQHGIH